MKGAVLAAVKDFCVQDEEFAQAVVQGGTFAECMKKVVEKYCDNSDYDINIDALYPFMDEEDISELFRAYLKRNKKTD